MTHENPVRAAIQKLGGMTATVVATRVSEATWHRWRRAGRIGDPEVLFRVADLTGIPARDLAGLANGGSTPPSPSGTDGEPSRIGTAKAQRLVRSARQSATAASLTEDQKMRAVGWVRASTRDGKIAPCDVSADSILAITTRRMLGAVAA